MHQTLYAHVNMLVGQRDRKMKRVYKTHKISSKLINYILHMSFMFEIYDYLIQGLKIQGSYCGMNI